MEGLTFPEVRCVSSRFVPCSPDRSWRGFESRCSSHIHDFLPYDNPWQSPASSPCRLLRLEIGYIDRPSYRLSPIAASLFLVFLQHNFPYVVFLAHSIICTCYILLLKLRYCKRFFLVFAIFSKIIIRNPSQIRQDKAYFEPCCFCVRLKKGLFPTISR